jgi:hypothetical protein
MWNFSSLWHCCHNPDAHEQTKLLISVENLTIGTAISRVVNFLKAYRIDQVIPLQVDQMCCLFIVGRSDPLRHDQNERAVKRLSSAQDGVR